MNNISVFIIESTNQILFTYPAENTKFMNINDQILFGSITYTITKKTLDIDHQTLTFFVKKT